MWSPTHVQVLVKRAKGLKIKGKDGKTVFTAFLSELQVLFITSPSTFLWHSRCFSAAEHLILNKS